jgi:hypothetical protein
MIHKMSGAKKLFLAAGLLSLIGADSYGKHGKASDCTCENVIDNTNVNVGVNVNVQEEFEIAMNVTTAEAEEAISGDETLSEAEKEQQSAGVRRLAELSLQKLPKFFSARKNCNCPGLKTNKRS